MPRSIAIVAALPEEVRSIRRRHRLARSKGDLGGWRGSIAGYAVKVLCTGAGESNARAGVERLGRRARPAAIVFIGVAGSLSPALGIGDLLVADRVRRAGRRSASELRVPPSPWLDRAVSAAAARPATLVSTARVLTLATEKAELARTLDPTDDACAVDLESYVWVEWALASGLPFVLLRSVSDLLDEDLPIDLAAAFDPDASLARTKLLAGALRRPRRLPGLWMLRGRVNRCADTLEKAVVAVLGGARR